MNYTSANNLAMTLESVYLKYIYLGSNKWLQPEAPIIEAFIEKRMFM